MNTAIVALYVMAQFVGIISYGQQAVSVLRDGSAASAISLAAWTQWLACSAIALVYAIMVVEDRTLILAYIGGTAGVAAVLAATVYKRRAAVRALRRGEAAAVLPV